jgi:hypothetical protein
MDDVRRIREGRDVLANKESVDMIPRVRPVKWIALMVVNEAVATAVAGETTFAASCVANEMLPWRLRLRHEHPRAVLGRRDAMQSQGLLGFSGAS